MIDLTKLTKEDVLFSLLERYIKEQKKWRESLSYISQKEYLGDEFEDYDNTPEQNFKYAVESMIKEINSYTLKDFKV